MYRQKAIAIFVLVAVCFGALSISVSAESVSFLNVPESASFDGGIFVGVYSTNTQCFSGSSNSSSVYVFSLGTGSFYGISVTSGDNVWFGFSGSIRYNASCTTVQTVNNNTYYTSVGVAVPGSYEPDSSVPVFSSVSDAVSAFDSFINVPPVEPFDTQFILPAGSVAFLELSSYDSITELDATMYDLSTVWLAGSEPWFWPSDLAMIGFRSSLPELNSQWSTSDLDMLRWQRDSNRNIYGQTKSAIYDDVFSSSDGTYLVLYNPAYYVSDLTDGDMYLSPSISVNIINVLSVRVYSVLQGTINGVSQSMVGNAYYDRTEDGSWEDSDGGSSPPPEGGGNYIPDQGDQTGVLDNLVSTIGNFFTGTWSHIRGLIDALGGFPSMMKEIFGFLPSSFTSIILSFFGILVAVGVLKALL